MNLNRIRQLRTYLGQRQSHHSLTIDNGQAAELDAALAAAEALARLEAFPRFYATKPDGNWLVGIEGAGLGSAKDLLTALTRALDEARRRWKAT